VRIGLREMADKPTVRALVALEQHRGVRGERAFRPDADQQREAGPFDMIEQHLPVLDRKMRGCVDHGSLPGRPTGRLPGELPIAQAAACSAVIASPATVVRRMSRFCVSSKSRARCIVTRLSHITRSLTRHWCA
jgi:hypothetical protein